MPTPPNLLFILVDDTGYGDFSAFNGGLSQTPTLGALMTDNVCFTRHYSVSPVCDPPPELYYVVQDPLEQNNLAAQHPEVVSRLLRGLGNWFDDVESDRKTITAS